MKTYLVGGAVRDKLLGLEVQENDYVVVGATPEEMLALKFKPVGKDFPVFLHPKTKEEYALARTERKTAKGYHGFAFYYAKDVTLEEDLKRRDFTINAIAKDNSGNLIDPYHGQQDLENKIIHHVSEQFCEDPVRVLRAARFLARFTYLNFSIHASTLKLMRAMVKSGEVNHLTPERVAKELEKTLLTNNPEQFFICLEEVGALAVIFSMLDFKNLFIQKFNILKKAIKDLESDKNIRLTALLLGLYSNYEIKKNIKLIIKSLHKFYRHFALSKAAEELSVVTFRLLQFIMHDLIDAQIIFELVKKVDLRRKPARFYTALSIVNCYATICALNSKYLKTDTWQQIMQKLNSVDVQEFLQQGLTGKELERAIKNVQCKKLSYL